MKDESSVVTRLCELREKKCDIQDEYRNKTMPKTKKNELHNIQIKLKVLYWVLDDGDQVGEINAISGSTKKCLCRGISK